MPTVNATDVFIDALTKLVMAAPETGTVAGGEICAAGFSDCPCLKKCAPDMAEYYLWFKALHIISVIAWMAGMLYLPRLYVYHIGCHYGVRSSQKRSKFMERRLLR